MSLSSFGVKFRTVLGGQFLECGLLTNRMGYHFRFILWHPFWTPCNHLSRYVFIAPGQPGC